MSIIRPTWIRGLRLYSSFDAEPWWSEPDPGVPTRSTFQSVEHETRLAEYALVEATARSRWRAAEPAEHHTLVVVREFRRVPLHASALGLLLLTAREGRGAELAATAAHWLERAVSAYQPAYVLLAHSLECPRLSMLLAGVHECAALQAASGSAFNVDALAREVDPLLDVDPELYRYRRAAADAVASALVSPFAV